MTPPEIKAIRNSLKLTQQQFASLLGLSFVSINKWENGASAPTGLSSVLLQLLRNSLLVASRATVIHELHACRGVPIEVIRALIRLEQSNA